MARDENGHTRAERKAMRQAQREGGQAARDVLSADREKRPARRELGRYKSSKDSEVLVSRGRRAATLLVEVGPAWFELSHVQAWDLARSLMHALQHAHLGSTSAEPEDDEDEEGVDE